jgi:hypothetical protein
VAVAFGAPLIRVPEAGYDASRGGDEQVAKDHGSSVKDDKQYEGLRKKGMSKERAAKISNSPKSSQKKGGKKGGKKSGSKSG